MRLALALAAIFIAPTATAEIDNTWHYQFDVASESHIAATSRLDDGVHRHLMAFCKAGAMVVRVDFAEPVPMAFQGVDEIIFQTDRMATSGFFKAEAQDAGTVLVFTDSWARAMVKELAAGNVVAFMSAGGDPRVQADFFLKGSGDALRRVQAACPKQS